MALGVNVAAALLLTPALGHVGLALALSLSSWANTVGLAWLLARHGRLRPDAGSCAAAASPARGGHWRWPACCGPTASLLAEPGLAALVLVIGTAGGAFLLAAWAAGAVDLAYWRRASRA